MQAQSIIHMFVTSTVMEWMTCDLTSYKPQPSYTHPPHIKPTPHPKSSYNPHENLQTAGGHHRREKEGGR